MLENIETGFCQQFLLTLMLCYSSLESYTNDIYISHGFEVKKKIVKHVKIKLELKLAWAKYNSNWFHEMLDDASNCKKKVIKTHKH